MILFTNAPFLNLGGIGNKFNCLHDLPLNILPIFYTATPVNWLINLGVNPILTKSGSSKILSLVNLLSLCASPWKCKLFKTACFWFSSLVTHSRLFTLLFDLLPSLWLIYGLL